ncbi:MAG: aminoglycoside phosphotransferase family protein [Bacteroidales bacterium]|nr:aminoglycoside phosphotransferase family protein [Bacteroidales bacterium]
MENKGDIVSRFRLSGTVQTIEPLGSGLINDTFKVKTNEADAPDYVLQRINDKVFTDVDMLQRNVETVTSHIRAKLAAAGEKDLDRHVLRLVETKDGRTYTKVGDEYWRMTVLIPDAYTYEAVNPQSSYCAGKAFGEFESMLADLETPLGETIPDFHNMEFRLWQFKQALHDDKAARAEKVAWYTDELMKYAEEMCKAERLHREGKLPKRICHCDTKVSNMMFDADGNVLCVIDLDTVMPSFVFSDYGDFLRTAANTGAEDDADLDKVDFNMDIFKAFTKGYIESAGSFLLPIEIENLPYAATLFPYMQAIRFLADYINGDTYYNIRYPEHNFVRTKAQLKLFSSAYSKTAEMADYIQSILG